jgi:hypothetical protein
MNETKRFPVVSSPNGTQSLKNVIILGAGRSGTSLLAGLFHDSGYYSGTRLWDATGSNPLGYFEDIEINKINEALLGKVVPWRPPGLIGALMPVLRDRPRFSQRWLSALPAGTSIPSTSKLDGRMAAQTSRQPYLFKDPRFSYTLSSWAPHLAEDTIFLCVFREPQRTVDSILRIIGEERYLRDLNFSRELAYDYWRASYESVLMQRSLIGGEWLFIHFDEILDGRSIPLLEKHLQSHVDTTMLRPDLRRSSPLGICPPSVQSLFERLNDLSERKYLVS